MKKKNMIFLFLTAAMYINVAHAEFQIRGTIKGGAIHWDNLSSTDSGKIPSEWGTPPSLQTVEAWSPGTFAAPPPVWHKLHGSDGSSTDFIEAIEIKGMQFNTTGIEFSESKNPLSNGCEVDRIALPLIEMNGESCVSSKTLNNLNKSAPFIFYRPIVSVNEDVLVSALEGFNEGVYSTSIPITIRYYYENDGITTYRNINEMVIFSFKYEPVQLDSITVIGNGVMAPNYDTISKRVSANTKFDITATGYFDDGITLTLTNQDYELVHSESSDVTIPYDISCPKCNVNQLVKSGDLLNGETSISKGAGVQTIVDFSLDFDYDVEGGNVISGDYFDEVTIMLEPRL